jgi:hypothetical protein
LRSRPARFDGRRSSPAVGRPTHVSFNQWLALTPPDLVQAHLKLDIQAIGALHKEKFPVVPG